jgi:hypothetical protein
MVLAAMANKHNNETVVTAIVVALWQMPAVMKQNTS